MARRLDAVMSATPTLQGAIDKGKPIKIVGDPLFYEPLGRRLRQELRPLDSVAAGGCGQRDRRRDARRRHAVGDVEDSGTERTSPKRSEELTAAVASRTASWGSCERLSLAQRRGYRSGASWRPSGSVIFAAVLGWFFCLPGSTPSWIAGRPSSSRRGRLDRHDRGRRDHPGGRPGHDRRAGAALARTRCSYGSRASTPRSSAARR